MVVVGICELASCRAVVDFCVSKKKMFKTLTSPSLLVDRFNSNSRCVDTETGRELYVGDSFTRSGRCIRVQCLDTLELWEDR